MIELVIIAALVAAVAFLAWQLYAPTRIELPPEPTPIEEEPVLIEIREQGPLVHGGGLGDLRSSRQPVKESHGNQ